MTATILRNRTTEVLSNQNDLFITPKIDFKTFGETDDTNDSIFSKNFKPKSRRRSKNPKCRKGKSIILSRDQLYLLCFGYIKQQIIINSVAMDVDNYNIPDDVISIILSAMCNWDTIVFNFKTDINADHDDKFNSKNNNNSTNTIASTSYSSSKPNSKQYHRNGLILIKHLPLYKDLLLERNNYNVQKIDNNKDTVYNPNSSVSESKIDDENKTVKNLKLQGNTMYTLAITFLSKQCNCQDENYSIDCGIIGISKHDFKYKINNNTNNNNNKSVFEFEDEFLTDYFYCNQSGVRIQLKNCKHSVKHYLHFQKDVTKHYNYNYSRIRGRAHHQMHQIGIDSFEKKEKIVTRSMIQLMSSMCSDEYRSIYGSVYHPREIFRVCGYDGEQIQYDWMISEKVEICIKKKKSVNGDGKNAFIVYFEKDGKRVGVDDTFGIGAEPSVSKAPVAKLDFKNYDYYFLLSCPKCDCQNKKGFQFEIQCTKTLI